MKAELLSITNYPEELIVKAGRTCYLSEKKDTPESIKLFIKSRIKEGHESILEHASASFRITGVSRALTHQLVRHRLASFSQQSQRYVKESTFDFVTPDSIKDHESKNIYWQYRNFMDQTQKFYNYLVDSGVKPEDARFVLPNAVCSEIVVTANFREWKRIGHLRLDSHAQWEFRDLMKQIMYILLIYAPNVFAEFKEEVNEEAI
jgi:thymidylate synthase (FAD)